MPEATKNSIANSYLAFCNLRGPRWLHREKGKDLEIDARVVICTTVYSGGRDAEAIGS